jgi:hypothetical protein
MRVYLIKCVTYSIKYTDNSFRNRTNLMIRGIASLMDLSYGMNIYMYIYIYMHITIQN